MEMDELKKLEAENWARYQKGEPMLNDKGQEIKVINAMHPQRGIPVEVMKEIWGEVTPEEEEEFKRRHEETVKAFREGRYVPAKPWGH